MSAKSRRKSPPKSNTNLKTSVQELTAAIPKQNEKRPSRLENVSESPSVSVALTTSTTSYVTNVLSGAPSDSGSTVASLSQSLSLSTLVDLDLPTTQTSTDVDPLTAQTSQSSSSIVAPLAVPEDARITDHPVRSHPKKSRDQLASLSKNNLEKLDEVSPHEAESSKYSYYMTNDFRYYFQHPYARLFIAYVVTLCNFFIYAEDPVAHSLRESNIPMIGNDFAFVFSKYPPNAWRVLKVLMWLAGMIVGMVVGKIIVHGIIFNHLFRLDMFSDDKGSWMIMFFSTLLSVLVFSVGYNLLLMIGGDSTLPYRISTDMGITNNTFMKFAATGTWCGDFFTAWMVTDMMLQERLYPKWAVSARYFWKRGFLRIFLFWVVVILLFFIVLFIITTDIINWDSLNHDFLHTNEVSRTYLASCILVMDVTIVMQDWDFPHFVGAFDIKLPGVNVAHIRFNIPKLLTRMEYWRIHISGKWFNYGILFMVLLLDFNMLKNQVIYDPYKYGQYTDSHGHIHTVHDRFSLDTANRSALTYAYRNTTKDPITDWRYIQLDTVMNSRYFGSNMDKKAFALVPCVGVFVVLGIFIWFYGRLPKPTKSDPYAGRLQKRQSTKWYMRLGGNRMRIRLRSRRLTMLYGVPSHGEGGKKGGGKEEVVKLRSEGERTGEREEQSEVQPEPPSKVESELPSKMESELPSKVESEPPSKVELELPSKVESEPPSKVQSELLVQSEMSSELQSGLQ